MTLPLVIVGLILELAGKSWFSGAGTVGTICLVVGGLGLILQLVIFLGVLALGARRLK